MTMIQTLCPHCLTPNRIEQARLGERPKCGKCHQLLFVGAPLAADDVQFQRLLTKEQLPLVVDFWAEWCGPCKAMAPVFARVAAELEPRARFVKVDTERAQQSASQFNIRSIPTLIVFKNGKLVTQQAGALPYQSLMQWLNSVL